VGGAIEWLSTNPAVEFAHPNYRIAPAFDPNDVRYPQQWHLNNTGQNLNDPNDPADPVYGTLDADMDVDLAWDLFANPNLAGSTSVVVGVLDYGIMPTHEDILNNLWVNPGEDIDEPPYDDDSNGCKDDINGCNFADTNNYLTGLITEPVLGSNHGMAVAGVIGARGNNIGVSGIMRRASIMSLKMQPTDPKDPNIGVAAAIDAIDYGIAMGADIMNASWNLLPDPNCSSPCAPALRDAIMNAWEHEVLFVTSAGNETKNVDSIDPSARRWPCMYDLPNIICVADTDENGAKYPASNWGAVSVDVAGTGNFIWTLRTYAAGSTRYIRSVGLTSIAAASITGIGGLVRAKNLDIPAQLIRDLMLDSNSIDYISALDPNTGTYPVLSGGRANAYKTLVSFDSNPPSAITNFTGTAASNTTLSVQWASTGDDGTSGGAKLNQVRTSTGTITLQNWNSAKRAFNEPTPATTSGVTQSMTISGLNHNTVYKVGLRSFDEWGNGPLSNVITCRTRGPCQTSYCDVGSLRCTNIGYGSGCNGCCQYSCVVDESCMIPDPCPSNACLCQ